MNKIYVTDEYPNPPKRISIREARDIGILMEPYSKKSIKEYFKNVLKRKEQKVMKFKVGDRVRIKKPSSYHNNMVAVITKTNYESITDKLGYQIHINGFPSPNSLVWFDEELELIERAGFTKSDLKDGMVVEYRNGERALVLTERLLDKGGYINISEYKYDLTKENPAFVEDDGKPSYDILKVYAVKTGGPCDIDDIFKDYCLKLIWERKEEPDYKEMTVAEIEKKLGYKVKIVDGE